MKKLLFLLLVLLVSGRMTAQSFLRIDTVQVIDDSLPLKNAWAGGMNYPMFREIDLNGDGRMDLVAFEPLPDPGHNRLMPFINLGDSGKVNYHYAPEYIDLFPPLNGWLLSYDYNCDGKMDLFTLSLDCGCGITVYRNDYTNGGGLHFTKILNHNGGDFLNGYFGDSVFNIPANTPSVPEVLDVDGDGDMDIIGWNVSGSSTVAYYHGLAVDSGWSCDSLRFKLVTECWGHFGLNGGTNTATLGVTCRQAIPDSALNWDAGITMHDDTQSCICVYNQDGNAFKDILVGGFADINLNYMHNGGSTLSDSMDYQNINWPVYTKEDTLNTYPCTYHLDGNNDGKKDMIVSPHGVSDYRGIQYYKNTDVPLDTGIFIRQPETFLQQEMIEVGTTACPQIFDYDCDGLPDLFVGDLHYHDTTGLEPKGIALYKNIGSPSVPKFKLMTRDFAGINALNQMQGPFTSTFGDVDGDGDPDMIIGSGDGKLYLFQNNSNSCNASAFQFQPANYMGIDAGNQSVPQLYDLNHDGHLDLIIGNSSGIIKYYQNNGTGTPFSSTPTKDSLGGIVTRSTFFTSGNAAPAFYIDSGVEKLVVGTYGGKLYIYDNIAGNIFGKYHLADSLINGEEGQNLIPAVGDINNDGRPDLVIGNTAGGVSLFMNSFTIGVNELHSAVRPSFEAYPNPVKDELHLNFYHIENKHASLKIINSIGQMVYSTGISEDKLTVSLKNLANGIYLARFETVDNAQSLKIIVQH